MRDFGDDELLELWAVHGRTPELGADMDRLERLLLAVREERNPRGWRFEARAVLGPESLGRSRANEAAETMERIRLRIGQASA